MTTSLARPLPLSRVWSGNKVLAEDLAGEDLADVLDLHADAAAWWVLDRSSSYAQDELRRLAKALGLDDLAVADLTAIDHRAKFEQIGQARIVLTNAVALDSDTAELSVHPLSLLITDRALICLADVCGVLDPARWLSAHADRLAASGVEAAAQVILQAVVAGYGDVIDWLEDQSDELAELLFEERPFTKEEQLRAFRLRRLLSDLRRFTDPMRGVMADLRVSGPAEDPGAGRPWTSLEEQHSRTASAAERLRDELASAFETSLALADVQLNTIMKKLTAWAAIIAAPTLITSFLGMNLHYPLLGTTIGFWVYFAVTVVVSVLLYFAFKRRDWV